MTFRIEKPGIEEWRPVLGFPEYEVSNIGRVRSLDRIKTYRRVCRLTGRRAIITRPHKGKVLSPGSLQSGHQVVVLGRGKMRTVHQLVLEAFIGPAPDGTECCHWDDDPYNNNLSNLRWDTRAATCSITSATTVTAKA